MWRSIVIGVPPLVIDPDMCTDEALLIAWFAALKIPAAD
jgi:hypothetical protein